MKKLTVSQLRQVKQALHRNHPHRALQAELLDHLAMDIEHRMAAGQPYEAALHQVMEEASPQAIAQLKQTYQQALNLAPMPIVSGRLATGRYRRHRSQPGHYQQWLQGSVIAFVTLMICLMWVSQVFAMPLKAFGNVWLVGLSSLLVVFCARLLFQRRSRRVRHRWG
ncbi:hypothetical protein [Spirosoma koreense]